MSVYINHSLLEDLFAGVELQDSTESRLATLNGLTDAYIVLAVNSLERIAYDLSGEGWTVRQIADEIGVGSPYITGMIAAHAARTGLPSPQRQKRSYEHAVDISRLVSREVRRRATDPPQPTG